MTAKAKYDMTVYPVQVAVRSQSDGAAVHMVTLPHCDCADFTNRKGQLVPVEPGARQRRLGVQAHRRGAGERRRLALPQPEPEPQVHSGLRRRAVQDILTDPDQGDRSPGMRLPRC